MTLNSKKYNVKPGQNIFDIAIEQYGTVEGAIDIWQRNAENTLDDWLVSGETILVNKSPALNENNTYFTNREVTIATGSNLTIAPRIKFFDQTFDNTFD